MIGLDTILVPKDSLPGADSIKVTVPIFNKPEGIAVDIQGNIYVTDDGKISKIRTDGVISVLIPDYYIQNPQGVAIDAAGNVYVVDENRSQIIKINSNGVLSILAGGYFTNGSVDGIGTAASFDHPSCIAVDALGNVYVTELYKVRKISPSGVVTTIAGSGKIGSNDGTGENATFYGVWGIALDKYSNVYVADMLNNKIRKISPAGAVTTLAGSGIKGSEDGIGTKATFSAPGGLAIDAFGNIYVGDGLSNKIRKITSSGTVTTLAGSGLYGSNDGTYMSASFSYPAGVAVDASGNIYVADWGSNKIRKITQ